MYSEDMESLQHRKDALEKRKGDLLSQVVEIDKKLRDMVNEFGL
jgi:hypothetical protein